MPGRLWNRCGPCAKRLPNDVHTGRDRRGRPATWHSVNTKAFNVERTGRTRTPSVLHSRRQRFAGTEWRCRECGHVWWSTHK